MLDGFTQRNVDGRTKRTAAHLTPVARIGKYMSTMQDAQKLVCVMAYVLALLKASFAILPPYLMAFMFCAATYGTRSTTLLTNSFGVTNTQIVVTTALWK
jgi:hypothetical protein